MTEIQFREFCEFFVKRNNIEHVDCISEIESIADKKSTLSKIQRDAVSAITAFSIKSGMKDYLVEYTVANKLDKCFQDIFDIKVNKRESLESAISKFLKDNENYKFEDPGFFTVSKLECFVLFYSFMKIFPEEKMEKGKATDIIRKLQKDKLDMLFDKSKKIIENVVKLSKNNEEFQKLFELKLLF